MEGMRIYLSFSATTGTARNAKSVESPENYFSIIIKATMKERKKEKKIIRRTAAVVFPLENDFSLMYKVRLKNIIFSLYTIRWIMYIYIKMNRNETPENYDNDDDV